MTRRELFKKCGDLGIALTVPGMSGELLETLHGRPLLDPNTLARFVDPLPIPPVARPAGVRPSPENPALMLPCYRIEMCEVLRKVHRDLPPTRMWLYGGTMPGPTIEARSGQGLWIEWVNRLPAWHLFPVDHHIHGAEADKPNVRAVVHVHGARAPSGSDGYPEHWYTPGQSRTLWYPNRQEAAMLWYHDHAMGITRLNNFAGLTGLFMVRDEFEDALDLPSGPYEIPLAICDRAFTSRGQLAYSVSPAFMAPWVPEFAGNTIVINGRIFPYLAVEPRKYRWRVLNHSNGRYLTLSLGNRHLMHQIGSDQGLLAAPADCTRVTLAPAERADLIVDFSADRGQQLMLRNDSSDVMLVRVAARGSADRGTLPARLRPVPRLSESAAVRTRVLTLDEYQDARGNTLRSLLNATLWHMPITENPRLDSVEIWSFVNLTLDSHPIHLHLVRFQLLDRRPFDVAAYKRSRRLDFTGSAIPPDPGESGWKDTIRADPGMVTRIIIRFEGFAGRYVWHCHILEHEDNEMMRPYEVMEG